jgi:hypothetical protein
MWPKFAHTALPHCECFRYCLQEHNRTYPALNRDCIGAHGFQIHGKNSSGVNRSLPLSSWAKVRGVRRRSE